MIGKIFGTQAVISSMMAELEAYRKDALRFNAIRKSLPIEEANKLREERRKDMEGRLKHQRALEIAREGRPLNFWGNR